MLFNRYNGSLYSLVSENLPGFEYLPWLFDDYKKTEYFSNPNVRRRYIEWLMAQVGVTSMSDLRQSHFRKHKGGVLLSKYNYSIAQVLESIGVRYVGTRERWVLIIPP